MGTIYGDGRNGVAYDGYRARWGGNGMGLEETGMGSDRVHYSFP